VSSSPRPASGRLPRVARRMLTPSHSATTATGASPLTSIKHGGIPWSSLRRTRC
jgi:hypothetical protein